MGRAAAIAAALLAVGVVAGCGSGEDEQKLSDSKIESALNIENSSTGLRVGSNPLCGIDQILNDADEVASLKKAQQKLTILSKKDTVGVVVITPFAKACQREMLRDLNKLERQTQKKKG